MSNRFADASNVGVDFDKLFACILGTARSEYRPSMYPECFPELLAMYPDQIGPWVYRCLVLRILRLTTARLKGSGVLSRGEK
jgi:hypothetical protein